MTELDPTRALIIARLDALGLDLANVSKAIGANAAYMQQYLRRGIPRVLPEDKRERLAALLQVSPDALRGAVPGKGAPRQAAPDAIATTDDEIAALRAFRALPPSAQKQALTILATLAG